MKRKDIKLLNQKSPKELTTDAIQKRVEIRKLQLEEKVKAFKNNRIRRILKDDLARILTVLREKIDKQKEIV